MTPSHYIIHTRSKANGARRFHTMATSPDAAREIVCKAERCPASIIYRVTRSNKPLKL